MYDHVLYVADHYELSIISNIYIYLVYKPISRCACGICTSGISLKILMNPSFLQLLDNSNPEAWSPCAPHGAGAAGAIHLSRPGAGDGRTADAAQHGAADQCDSVEF